MAPGRAFLPAFAGVLAQPVLQQSPLSFFSGRSYVLGRFGGREIAIRLQQKRGRYQAGYLVIASNRRSADARRQRHRRIHARRIRTSGPLHDCGERLAAERRKRLAEGAVDAGRLCDLSGALRRREVASGARGDGRGGGLAGSSSPGFAHFDGRPRTFVISGATSISRSAMVRVDGLSPGTRMIIGMRCTFSCAPPWPPMRPKP